jgi:signal peptidase I
VSASAQARSGAPNGAGSGADASHLRLHLPSVPDALASLMRTIVVALFLLTFVLQTYLIPSESMERTLLVGDFLLVNKQVFSPSGALTRWLMPYREPRRGDVIVFHHPRPPLLVKRIVGLPGDRIRIRDGRAWVNGAPLSEPYAVFDPAAANPARDNFPAAIYSDPGIDLDWWHSMQSLVVNGELTVPPGQYFVLGDNRDHSADSRFWGFVPRQAIVARPLLIYFSLSRSFGSQPSGAERPSGDDAAQGADDKLGHDRELMAKLTGFARWERVFRVVR